MTPLNIRSRILNWTDFSESPDPGNAGVLSLQGDFGVFELIQNTASTQETRTLTGPTKSGLECKFNLISVASGGTIQIALNNSAGSIASYVTLTTVGTIAKLESAVSAMSNGVKTFAWTVTFSNV